MSPKMSAFLAPQTLPPLQLRPSTAAPFTHAGGAAAGTGVVFAGRRLQAPPSRRSTAAVSMRHGAPLRGAEAVKDPTNPQGRFGRLFNDLPPATFGGDKTDDNLAGLGAAMKGDGEVTDGNDNEESTIPALYTYLGQFIDHDLTFDTTSTLQASIDPNALVNFRTPAFDLDNVYGRGPADQPYLYNDDGTFILGLPIGGTPGNRDVPRNANGRAIIGDPRNDENKIISQLQGILLRFHNRLIKEGNSYNEAQQLTRFHYQYVILNDFLPQLIDCAVLDGLRGPDGRFSAANLCFYKPGDIPFIPVEFSGACYRFGHSMVRPGYRMNDDSILTIFAALPTGSEAAKPSLTGNEPVPYNLGVDWGRLIDTDIREYGVFEPSGGPNADDKRRLQLAYRIDVSLVEPLSHLPLSVTGGKPFSLAERNLKRGVTYGLPSGQEVARAMGITPIDDEFILVGPALDQNPDTRFSIVDPAKAKEFDYDPNAFSGSCPLWAYILAEAALNKTPGTVPANNVTRPVDKRNSCKLGAVGGRIVAETFLGIMSQDKTSYLNTDPYWTPPSGSEYKLKDLVSFAIDK
jgi:Animal haem peroxidase